MDFRKIIHTLALNTFPLLFGMQKRILKTSYDVNEKHRYSLPHAP